MKNAQKFQTAVRNHVTSPKTLEINGTYRQSQTVVHYLNPVRKINVIKGKNGEFISGWKLNNDQLENVLNRGSL